MKFRTATLSLILMLATIASGQFSNPAAAVPDSAAAEVGEWLDEDQGDALPPSSGEELLAECQARMPAERVELGGWLNMRKRYGVTIKEFRFSVSADWRTWQPSASYQVNDSEKGTSLLRVLMKRSREGALLIERTDYGPAVTDTASPVLGTDVTWLDVGLDYVWWNKNPRLAGEDRLKGRTCDILEVEPPSPIQGFAKVRLWIDRSQKVVLQAAQVDESGRERRKLWVRAVQKVQERWIFKDLEVETLGSGHRTRLHFDDVLFPDAVAE